MPSITQKLVGPELLHARYKTAQWCRILSSREIRMDSNFFTCLQFATGELGEILFELKEKMPSRNVQARIEEILETPERDLDDELEGLLRRRPTLAGPMRHIVDGQCAKTMAALAKVGKCKTYEKAGEQMQELFGLSPDGVVFCEFVYLCQTFNPLERYFEDHLEIYKRSNHRMLGVVLGLRPDAIERCIAEMSDAAVLEDDHRSYFRLDAGVMRLWDGRGGNPEALFCQRLEGDALPMDAYPFPAEDIRDIAGLMRQTDGTPVHLLLYGSPGTGKTAFARSLAAHLKVDALSVLSRERDDDGDRRASLTASLRLASRRKGAFVLVDEAERLLDTDWRRFDGSKDKAWLNRFLERRDQRIVWITNNVEHIDQAVLRRFTRSLHFEELGVRERKGVWERLAKEHGVATLLPVERRAALAEAYDVPVAVIEKAIVQGKTLGGKKDFAGVAERALKSHVILAQSGAPIMRRPRLAKGYSLDGVSIKGDIAEVVERCRKLDTAMRNGKQLEPMSGNMLFYGPPGTGKTALARHIAHELDRECVVVLASTLLNRYVGETEKNIAATFHRGEKDGAVLVFDEADSFIFTRDMAMHSWESTQVNEFLTQLEECQCLCVCTTNRREGLDKASMRRFAYKLEFEYSRPEQIEILYEALLAPLASSPLSDRTRGAMCGMRQLTPGDFHVVRTQHCHDEPGSVDPDRLVRELRQTVEAKLEEEGRHLGF